MLAIKSGKNECQDHLNSLVLCPNYIFVLLDIQLFSSLNNIDFELHKYIPPLIFSQDKMSGSYFFNKIIFPNLLYYWDIHLPHFLGTIRTRCLIDIILIRQQCSSSYVPLIIHYIPSPEHGLNRKKVHFQVIKYNKPTKNDFRRFFYKYKKKIGVQRVKQYCFLTFSAFLLMPFCIFSTL